MTMRELLSEDPSKFKFAKGDRIKARVALPSNAAVGTIVEGFSHDGHALYVIETVLNRRRRLVVREEDIELIKKRTLTAEHY